jgi:hypothetical protein
MLEQGVKGVGLGLALSAIRRLVARGADGDGGLGQAEGQRLPGEGVLAEEVAQVTRGVVELEEGGGGDLGEEGFEDGGIGSDDGFEEAERGVVVVCGHDGAGGHRAGECRQRLSCDVDRSGMHKRNAWVVSRKRRWSCERGAGQP